MESKQRPKLVVWRINPNQCDYKLTNRSNELFVSGGENIKNKDIKKGDLILAVGSGKNSGLIHGLWYVEVKQNKERVLLTSPCWTEAARRERSKEQQWVVRARLVYDFSEGMSDRLRSFLPMDRILVTIQPLVIDFAYIDRIEHFIATI